MTPDEILRLRPARKQRFGDSERIVAPGQMLIFVSGHYPILGTQLLYFQILYFLNALKYAADQFAFAS